jgi:hypothetical protein
MKLNKPMTKVKLLKIHHHYYSSGNDEYYDDVVRIAIDEQSPWTEIDDYKLIFLKAWVSENITTHALIMYEDPETIYKCIEDQIQAVETRKKEEEVKRAKDLKRQESARKEMAEKKIAKAKLQLEKLKKEFGEV